MQVNDNLHGQFRTHSWRLRKHAESLEQITVRLLSVTSGMENKSTTARAINCETNSDATDGIWDGIACVQTPLGKKETSARRLRTGLPSFNLDTSPTIVRKFEYDF